MTTQNTRREGSAVSPEEYFHSFVEYLRSPDCVNASLTQIDDANLEVSVEISVEVPQRPAEDVRRREPVEISFRDSHSYGPTVYPREDFPIVPHLNLTSDERPLSLCLYEQPWDVVKMAWTPAHLVQRIGWWFRQTAFGELHHPNQSLEPFLFGTYDNLIVPDEFRASTPHSRRIRQSWAKMEMVSETVYRLSDRSVSYSPNTPVRVIAAMSSPVQHGVIRYLPKTIDEFGSLLENSGTDIDFRRLTQDAYRHVEMQGVERVVLLLQIRQTRGPRTRVENKNTFAFYTKGNSQALTLTSVVPVFSRKLAQQTSSTEQEGLVPQITAIGAGALGSQVVENLCREGYGRWTLIDNDRLMPHNISRHALADESIGQNKSEALANKISCFLNEDEACSFLNSQVSTRGPSEPDVLARFERSDLILDMSASTYVSRHLASDITSAARRASLFLNANGDTLVLLGEDRDRDIPLDAVEMQYYRETIDMAHIHKSENEHQVSVGQGCGDMSFVVPQSLVAMHAGMSGLALRKYLKGDGATIQVWTLRDDEFVKSVSVTPKKVIRREHRTWTILTDYGLTEKVRQMRECRLPNETGGVLLGHIDMLRHIIYVIDALPSPPDSIERPYSYIRGTRGLPDKVDEVRTNTNGALMYVGEWHSHPDQSDAYPSHADLRQLDWVAKYQAEYGWPGLIMVMGAHWKFEFRLQE